MPFRGKPSSGCTDCRRLRKKCDLRPGGCSRCVKANRICSGYRAQDELRIVDQSFEVIQKATTTRENDSSSGSSPSSQTSSRSVSPLWALQTISDYPDRDDHSLAFFFRSFVVNIGKRKSVVDVPGNEHLISSIKALGFAGISKNTSGMSSVNLARKQYVEALRLTNAALREPHQVSRDETLLAVLVLTQFETINGGANRTLKAWEQHVNGAASLLSLRGEDALKRDDGRWMTLGVITNVGIACLRQNIPIPPVVHKIQERILNYVKNSRDPAWILQSVTLDTVDFRYAVSHGLMRSTDEIISRAWSLDADLANALENPPSYWNCEIVGPRTISDNGLPDFRILYTDQATAYIWCCMRAARIMCLETALTWMAVAEANGMDVSRYLHHRLNMKSVVREMQSEVIASTPQYIGFDHSVAELNDLMMTNRLPPASEAIQNDRTAIWSNFRDPTRYPRQEIMQSTLPTLRIMGGYGILWPLLSSGLASTRTPAIVKYLGGVLDVLGDRFRIDQAMVIKEMLNRLT